MRKAFWSVPSTPTNHCLSFYTNNCCSSGRQNCSREQSKRQTCWVVDTTGLYKTAHGNYVWLGDFVSWYLCIIIFNCGDYLWQLWSLLLIWIEVSSELSEKNKLLRLVIQILKRIHNWWKITKRCQVFLSMLTTSMKTGKKIDSNHE